MVSMAGYPLLDEDDEESKSLVLAYSKAANQAALFAETFGDTLANDEHLQSLLQQLEGVRKDLAKSQYSIGFIGPSQSGKSTTVNYVLGVTDPDEQPCKEGCGDNTTSTVSRLLAGERSVKLVYMTTEQFATKREHLCNLAGLAPEATNEDLLARLPRRLVEATGGTAPLLPDGQPIIEHDIRALTLLLKSFQAHGHRLVSDIPKEVTVAYSDRSKYLNYGGNADPANPLLKEAVILFNSRFLPNELQIFDLPGPGAKSKVDDWTTQQYLPEMDGIMLFLSCTKLGDEAVERLYAQLRRLFKERVAKRVWIVITRWDGPQRPALDGDGEGSVFSAVNQLREDKKLPSTQIRFVCGPWYTNPDCAAFVKAHFERILGGRLLPEGLEKHPDLKFHFEQLFDAGGISSLRDLILNELPGDVRKEILESSAARLRRIQADLRRRFENEVRKQTANTQQAGSVIVCRMQLGELIMHMEKELPPFESAAIRLREQLTEVFERICNSASALDRFQTVPDDFPHHTQELEKTVSTIVETSLVPSLYGEWQTRLDALPGITVLDDDQGQPMNVGDAWRYFAVKDEKSILTEHQQFPSFLDHRLFATGDGPDAQQELAKGEAYWDMMKEKISLVSQQVVHAVRTSMVKRALEIKRELDELSRFDLNNQTASPTQFEAAIQRMKELAS